MTSRGNFGSFGDVIGHVVKNDPKIGYHRVPLVGHVNSVELLIISAAKHILERATKTTSKIRFNYIASCPLT